MRFLIHRGGWLLLLTGCLLSGCVKAPLPEKAAWPWETTKDYEKLQTGNFLGFRGNVASFDEPPKTVKPVSREDLAPHVPAANATASEAVTKAQSPALPTGSPTDSGKTSNSAPREYDFTVREIKTATPSYLPNDSVRSTYDVTAYNHGVAPVSVSIGIDPVVSQNIATDKTLPLNAVLAPNSDQALVRVGPKIQDQSYNFRTTYDWNIGDYTARHNCPEHYRFPFSNNVKAFATVSDDANTTTFTRYAVIFSLPVESAVLAARKGTVVRIRTDKIDILHDDSTIATYGHLGKIAEGIVTGKAVSTEDIIGVVGATADNKEGYLQLTVWRPEPLPVASVKTVSQSAGFDFVSFPLKFCSADSSECRVITHDQMVSRGSTPESKKQGKRTLKKRS